MISLSSFFKVFALNLGLNVLSSCFAIVNARKSQHCGRIIPLLHFATSGYNRLFVVL